MESTLLSTYIMKAINYYEGIMPALSKGISSEHFVAIIIINVGLLVECDNKKYRSHNVIILLHYLLLNTVAYDREDIIIPIMPACATTGGQHHEHGCDTVLMSSLPLRNDATLVHSCAC